MYHRYWQHATLIVKEQKEGSEGADKQDSQLLLSTTWGGTGGTTHASTREQTHFPGCWSLQTAVIHGTQW